MYVQGPLAAGNINQLDSATHWDQDQVFNAPLLTDTQGCLNSHYCTRVTVHIQKSLCQVPFGHFIMKLYCEQWFLPSALDFYDVFVFVCVT